jgi:microcystin-dependent protein
MSSPFLGEIRIFSFNFAPKGWAFCNGQLLPINQEQALFSLLGTTYGGNGTVNFALPNLQGNTPLHFGDGLVQGQVSGEQIHTLSLAEIPAHAHSWSATGSAANTPSPSGNLLGAAQAYNGSASNLVPMYPAQLSSVGGGQPHQNMQPFLTLNFCITLSGIFPSQN